MSTAPAENLDPDPELALKKRVWLENYTRKWWEFMILGPGDIDYWIKMNATKFQNSDSSLFYSKSFK